MCSIRTLFRKRMKLLGYLIRQLHNPKRLRAWKLHFLKGRREFFRKEFLVFVGSGDNSIVVYGQFGYFIKLRHVNTIPIKGIICHRG